MELTKTTTKPLVMETLAKANLANLSLVVSSCQTDDMQHWLGSGTMRCCSTSDTSRASVFYSIRVGNTLESVRCKATLESWI